jgi:bacillithiol synthase
LVNSSLHIKMPHKATHIDYKDTGCFSPLVLDYIVGNEKVKEFYTHPATLEGIKAAIKSRKNFNTDRQLLVEQLTEQYKDLTTSATVQKNIKALSDENTFTICTAHQPNIFTGHLYFIYKIIHAIKLADHLKDQLPDYNFVPVFYMGSEDADLEELGHIYLNGDKLDWKTKQTGAVGRMKVDDALIKLIDTIEGEIASQSHSKELIDLIRKAYTKGTAIQNATFKLVNELFAEYGLVVLLPDNPALKKQMTAIFKNDLYTHTPYEIVTATSRKLSEHYKSQAHPREINLFHLKDDIRNRIIKKKEIFYVEDTPIKFTKEEIREELKEHPERFSPNVILRGLYQEMILPNIAFIGGGGEIAYWLQMKDIFEHYKIPYPVLVLRNSFQVIEQGMKDLMDKLDVTTTDIFKTEQELINELVKKRSKLPLSLEKERKQVEEAYNQIMASTAKVDKSLAQHAEALRTKALKQIDKLEKKLLKSEKKNFEAEQRQVQKLKNKLFPQGQLQERIENFIPYYATYGNGLFKILYDNSLTLEQRFCLLID